MKTSITGKARNIIFIVFLSVLFVVILLTLARADGQNNLFLTDYRTYITASQLVNQDKYDQAKPLIEQLVQKHSDSYQVAWLYGLCLAGQGNYPEGSKYMKKAGEIRPALLGNHSYLVQYGEILYNLGDMSSAKLYLEESEKYGQDEQADKLLQNLRTTKISKGEAK